MAHKFKVGDVIKMMDDDDHYIWKVDATKEGNAFFEPRYSIRSLNRRTAAVEEFHYDVPAVLIDSNIHVDIA